MRDAEYDLHKSVPAVSACCKSVALQAAIKHGPTIVGLRLHWQDTSVGAQLAAEMAESRHDVYVQD